MGTLILILLVVWVGLILLLAAGTLFLQNYFNETPPELRDLAWRAPAAGSAVFVVIGLWALLCYNNPPAFAPAFKFSSTDTIEFKEFTAVKGSVRNLYKRTSVASWHKGKTAYLDAERRELAGRPDEIIVVEDDREVSFKPERDEQGNFKVRRGDYLRYLDPDGRVMLEGSYGQVAVSYPGRWWVYVLLNLLHGTIWFLSLWLLMRFPLGQAMMLGFGCWVAMTLLVMPPVLDKATELSAEADRETPSALKRPGEGPMGPPPGSFPGSLGCGVTWPRPTCRA